MNAGARLARPTTVSAVQVHYNDNGSEVLGLLTQIPRGADMEICGYGFTERTVRVRFKGVEYFVFREDIERTDQ